MSFLKFDSVRLTSLTLRILSCLDMFSNSSRNCKYVPLPEDLLNGLDFHKKEEKGFWQADTGSGDANLNKYDGAIKLIDALGNTINGNPDDITAVTSANIIAVVDKQIELIGEDWEDTDNKEVILGRDLYKMYTTALRNLNLYHHEAVKGDFSMQIPGAEDVTLRGVSGLNGTNRIFTTYWDNFMSGCDDESEEDEFRWVYDDVNEIWRLKIKFKSGVQVGFGQEIVQFELHTP